VADPGSGVVSRFHFIKMVVLATACTGVLGLALLGLIEEVFLKRILGHTESRLEDLFKNLPLIAASLFAVGLLIIAAGLRRPETETKPLTTRAAVWIGLVQGLCLPFRGFSRSGATISMGLFCGVARPLAEDFSFALAVVITPPVIGRSVYHLMKANTGEGSVGLVSLLLPGLVGMVFSFLAGLAALRFLSVVLERGRWKYFGFYCIAAAAVVLAALYLPP
jgi:undecaprenyl-diphosphatase